MITVTSFTGQYLSLSEAKRELRIIDSNSDVELSDVINEAGEWCEKELGLCCKSSATYAETIPRWPDSEGRWDSERRVTIYEQWETGVPVLARRRFYLSFPKWSSTGSVTYYDANGDSQTVSSSDYRTVQSDSSKSYIEFIDGWIAPDTALRDDAITITWTSTTSNLAKRAIKEVLKALWDGDTDVRTWQVLDRIGWTAAGLLRA